MRHKKQRSNRVRLKADAVVLLDRLLARNSGTFTDREIREIAEMRLRLAPATGVATPIQVTGYTK